jgi:nitrite reductase (NADH) large subunit
MATRLEYPTQSIPLWRAAQWLALTVTVVLLVGMVAQPKLALTVLWNLAIPLVPASLLVSPAIWRNVCPLATLNMIGNRKTGGRHVGPPVAYRYWAVGILLLLVLVPARRFLFNTDGLALAVTVGLVAVAAVVMGRFFDMKAGFCNTLCPVLPVERLYGQAPLLAVGNPRCKSCTLCTQTACLDLTPTKSIAQVLGRARQTHGWLVTGFGAFAAGFPGFIVGYNTLKDGPLAEAAGVYGHVALWMLGSYAVTGAVVMALRLTAARAMVLLAGSAAGLYYWFASQTLSDTLRLGVPGTVAFRVAFLSLVAVWFWRAGDWRVRQPSGA